MVRGVRWECGGEELWFRIQMIQGQTWAMLWTRECPAGACSHQKVGQWKVLPHAFGRTRTVRHSPCDMNSARQSRSEYELQSLLFA